MYVCICNGIKDSEIRDAATCCGGDAETVYGSLGHVPQCRQCLEEAEDIIAEERLSPEAAEMSVFTAGITPPVGATSAYAGQAPV